MRPVGRAILVVLIAANVLPTATARAAQAEGEPVLYAAPMTTTVIDPFRPPAHVGGRGNRGLEYGESDNQVVAAAAAGTVLFAGSVAGRKVITIEHRDGIRTTYTALLEIFVSSGQYVHRLAGIAIASSGFHFGARFNEHYLDPQILIDASQPRERVRLLPAPN